MTTLSIEPVRDQRATFAFLAECERAAPGDVNVIVRGIVDHTSGDR